ncbi:TadE/TadG family type IV pilus assembly protein [Massilia mucilaginosa]|nr:TadE family protein [Massilia mucilaginosa]
MTPPVRRRVRGIAHIELALVLSVMWILLPLIFSFGRIFYVSAALKQANNDAAASLAAVPMAEWVTSASATSPMKLRAIALVERALADTGVTPTLALDNVVITCVRGGMPSQNCGGIDRPESITVTLAMNIPMVGVMNMFDTGGGTLLVFTTVTVPYTN